MYLFNDKIYKTKNGKYYTEEYMLHSGSISGNTWSRGSVVTEIELADDVRCEFGSGKIIHCNYSQLFRNDDSIILCNDIVLFGNEDGDCLEIESYDDEYDDEIYQYFIINNGLAEFLKEHTDEIIYYHNKLDIYVLGVTHWGTSWDYVGAEYIV